MDKYRNMSDYSVKLNQSIESFSRIFYSKPPKQFQSFMVSLSALTNILDNMLRIQEMLDQMKRLTSLDEVAKKGNKSAKKVSEEIDSIILQLHANYSRLEDQFLKQISTCYEQCKQLRFSIKDKEERQRFNEYSRAFEIMAYEAKNEKYKIPFHQIDKYAELKKSQTSREHKEQENNLDEAIKAAQQDVDKLQEAYQTLNSILISTPKYDLSKDVEKEVAEIKRALSPKTIAISKEYLEQLRHSSHLLLDLAQISEIIKTTSRFFGKDGKLQIINKKLDALKSLLAQAIEDERKSNMTISQGQQSIQSKVNYATEAVQTYGMILNDNARIEQEQQAIRDNTHEYYEQNIRLEQEAQKKTAEAVALALKDERLKEANDGLKIDRLRAEARELREEVHANEKFMADKIGQKIVTQLPPQYTQMKKRLRDASSLNFSQMSHSHEFNSGGRAI